MQILILTKFICRSLGNWLKWKCILFLIFHVYKYQIYISWKGNQNSEWKCTAPVYPCSVNCYSLVMWKVGAEKRPMKPLNMVNKFSDLKFVIFADVCACVCVVEGKNGGEIEERCSKYRSANLFTRAHSYISCRFEIEIFCDFFWK